MIFKNKFKKQDADALKKEASQDVKNSDAVKNAEKDPKGTYDEAKDLAKKAAGKDETYEPSGGRRPSGRRDGASSEGGRARSSNGRGGQRTHTSKGSRPMTGEYGHEAGNGYEESDYSPPLGRQTQTSDERSEDMAGSIGGIGDPRDEFEETASHRRHHSEYIPRSSYGSPASPRTDVSRRTSESAGGERSRREHSAVGSRTRSPRRASLGARRVSGGGVNKDTSGRSDDGVAGRGTSDGAGGYSDSQERPDWDRRHSRGSFSFPFFHHFHRHHKDPKEEAEEVGGATSAGTPGMVGSGTPTRAPVRAHSKDYTSGSAAGPMTGRNSAAVAGADAAVRRSGGPVSKGDHAGRDIKRVPDHGELERDGVQRQSHGGKGASERNALAESRTSRGQRSQTYDEGYEAGYMAAKRGEPLDSVSDAHRRSNTASSRGGGSKSRSNPFEEGMTSEGPKYRETGMEGQGARESSRRDGNLGGAKEYGYGSGVSSADEFGNEPLDYETSIRRSRRHRKSYGEGVGGRTSSNVGYGSYEGQGVGRRMSSGRGYGASEGEGVGGRMNSGRDYGSYEGEGVGRRMSSGRGYGTYEGEGVGRRMSSGREYGTYEGEGVGRRMSPGGEYGAYEEEGIGRRMSPGGEYGAYEGEGVGRRMSSGREYSRNAAGYPQSPGAAVGPGSNEYPESYGDDYYGDTTGIRMDRGAHGNVAGTVESMDEGDHDGMGLQGQSGGLKSGVAKAVNQAGGSEKIKDSVDKAADSKVGGMAKGKATGFLNDELSGTKAGELADKGKKMPGGSDAAGKAEDVVGKGIKSKLGNAGGSAGAASEKPDRASGVMGSGARGGNMRGQSHPDSDSHGYGGSMPREELSRYEPRNGPMNDGYDDEYRPRRIDAHAPMESSGGYADGYESRRYGHPDLDGEMESDGSHEMRHGVYAPSGGRSYGGRQTDSRGGYGDEAGVYNMSEGRSAGYPVGVEDTDNRLRRASGAANRQPQGRKGESEVQGRKAVSATQEQSDHMGDNFSREVSVNSADYYDSSETFPGSREQGIAAAKKPAIPLEDRTVRSPSMSKPVDPYNQDTSVPRFGLRGLFGHKASGAEGDGDDRVHAANPATGGGLEGHSGEETVNQRGGSEKNAGVPPVARARSTPNFRGSTNPSAMEKPVEESGGPSGSEGTRFADTFGNMPSLINPAVPTYGWRGASGGPPPAAENAGGSEVSKRNEVPKDLPVMGKNGAAKGRGKQPTAGTGAARSPNKSGTRAYQEPSTGNYVTTGAGTRGRSGSLSDEAHGGAYDGSHYSKFERGHDVERGIGEEPEHIDESSKVPRSAEDAINPDNSEPGIFERIKSAFTSSSHGDTAATNT